MSKTLLIIGGIIIALILFVAMPLVGSYNNLVQKEVAVDESWSQVETQYQRRFDLVPQLVGAVRGILNQEQEVFGAIAEARTRYANARDNGSQAEQVEAYGEYESVIGRLMVIMENYPVLRSNEQVQSLMDELTGTENRVAVSRVRYNETVAIYELTTRRFPTNVIASIFGFEDKKYFESEAEADSAPEVDITVSASVLENDNN